MKRFIRIGLVTMASCALLSGCSKKMTQRGTSGDTTRQQPPAQTGDSQIQSPREESWTFDSQPTPAPSMTPKRRLNEITFLANSTDFGREGNGVCVEAGKTLKASPKKILLLGYCHKDENVGSGSNDLGIRRAEKVKACLKAQGVDVSGFEMSSFGSRYSKADHTAPMTMEQERRVEMWVMSE